MWPLSKHSRQTALEHSQLQSVILQRTAELQRLSQRLLNVRMRRNASCLVTCTTARVKHWQF